MAVRLMSEKSELVAVNGVTKFVGVVFADTKTDVTDNMTIDGDVLDFGSIAYTKDLDVATCDSTGHWNWQ